MTKEKVIEKLNSLLKEELWGRIEPKDVGISKFKILDDLFNNIVSHEMFDEIREICVAHLNEHPNSITASYLVGLIGYHKDRIEDTVKIRKLLEVFSENHKWAVVERISEKVLEYGENRIALKALATSLERLGKSKDAIPIWENLLKIDRFDAEVAKKLAFALIDEDDEKSILYMKLSIEGFIKNGEFGEIAALWNKLVSLTGEDLAFFERIERLLVDARQYELTAQLLKTLLHKYRDEENPDQSISILKRILEYTPEDTSSRRELIKLYGIKYKNHSQYKQFLEISKLNNFKVPVKNAIQTFERNIVFDKNNYVLHRAWGVGKIKSIDSESVVVDFKGKENHKMSIQMALQSLSPISKDHISVLEYEDPEGIKALFEEDFMAFFEILVRSYNMEISLNDIKKELIPKYIDAKSWSKWWNKKRIEIKKNPHFAFSEKKKDVIFMRDKPVTFADELLERFSSAEGFSNKLGYAMEFVNNIEREEGERVAQYFIDYFLEQTKQGSPAKQILSYFVLRDFMKFVDEKKLKLDSIRERIVAFIKKETQELPLISLRINSYDYKKDFVHLIMESREDWPAIVGEILFETPVRIHKYIINSLISAHAYHVINNFIDRLIVNAKQTPEVFFWVVRNIITRVWDYEWLDFSRESLYITFVRLMNELRKIETKGNRLKNMALEILFDNDAQGLREIVSQSTQQFLGKLFDLFISVAYVEDHHKEKFLSIIKEKYPDFSAAIQQKVTDEWEVDVEKIFVSQAGLNKMQAELRRMNLELVKISQELGKTVDVSGDIRENVDYNRLMESQIMLELSYNKLQSEVKKAEIINFDAVNTSAINIGTRVEIQNIDTGEKLTYSILGPWDADFEKGILSYRSPIAQNLLGKKVGDEVAMKVGEEIRKYKVISIEKCQQ
ncbi:MAG: transcription elongation factor GreA [Spirochaetes bacterium]|nr:transcription elongation factor GreA [Spirochaetota bacterium]